MGVSLRWLWAGLLPVACVFDTSEVTTEASVVDTETDGSTGEPDPGPPSDSTSGAQSGSGGASTDADTSGGQAVDPTQDADPTDPVIPRAHLVFVEPSPIDLGTHPLSGQDLLTLELTNDGDAAASILGAGDEPPTPLMWAGGTFPGTDGTCQGLIPPGATCTVALAVGPGAPGLVDGSVEVRFDDMIGVGKAIGGVQAIATGAGPNLIENPDAESDPPGAVMTGWDPGGSTFHTNGDHNHGLGELAFFAGGSENPELTQDVVLTPWADSIDALAMQFHFSGWTRARDEFWHDDPHGLQLLFLDELGQTLDSRERGGMFHDGWGETTFDAPLPVGTRRVRIRLTCDRNDNLVGNENCSAYFDDFFGGLVLPAP